jgi:F-box and leucine-rich repeat protein 2/20
MQCVNTFVAKRSMLLLCNISIDRICFKHVPNSRCILFYRRVKFLSLEGCSLLTTRGLESVITSWSDLQSLSVVSCNKIKDEEISPALSELFSNLKELKWRPDNKSLLAASLVGTGMGNKGRVFFKRV